MNNDFKDIFDNKELQNNPFKVPENYFDTLTERIMNRIPEENSIANAEKQKKGRILSLRSLRWAAAIACFFVVGATSVFYVSNNGSSSLATNNADTMSLPILSADNDIVTEAADYTMLDNEDMYQLLAEE